MFTKTSVRRSIGSRAALFTGCLCVSLVMAQNMAHAALFTLVDDNSSATFDTTSQAGDQSWVVDGVNQLNQQWFWYRVGNSAPEASIDTLPILLQGVVDSNFDGNNDSLFVRYAGNGFRLDVRFVLNGGSNGSLASDLQEQITIVNTTNAPLDFHFFQYNDYDLNGTAGGDSAMFTNSNAVQQWEGSSRFTETVVTPVATHRELAFFPQTLASLNDGLPTTLSDSPANGQVLGPGNVTWAFQWDFTIPAGGSRLISKDKNIQGTTIVPEPASWMLMAGGAAVMLAARWRRRGRKAS